MANLVRARARVRAFVPGRSRAGIALACAALAAALSGCGTSTSVGSSSVRATGTTLSIYLSDPPGIAAQPALQDIVGAEQLACNQDRAKVTDYSVRCITLRHIISDNARDAIVDAGAIAYIGEIAPGYSQDSVGITNALDLLQVSPTDGALELTQSTPVILNSPEKFYEQWSTYGRTFARVVPSTAEEAQAQVSEMRALHVTSLFVAHDGSFYGEAIAHAVAQDASASSISLASSEAGASAIFYGSDAPATAAHFFLAAPATAKLFGPAALNAPSFTAALGGATRQLYISWPGFLARDLPAAARAFGAQFDAAYGHAPASQAVFGYEAVAAVLHAIEVAGHSASDRETVIRDFFKIKDRASVLGTYSIDKQGDTTLASFVFSRLRAGRLVPFTSVP